MRRSLSISVVNFALYPVLCAALISACAAPAPSVQSASSSRDDAILGGQTNPGDPEVFMLIQIIKRNGSMIGMGACTATLISPHILLTAAHCGDARLFGQGLELEIKAINKTQVGFGTTPPADAIDVIDIHMHPGWNPNAAVPDNDVATLLLKTAPLGVTPKQWSRQALDSHEGKQARMVGYGQSQSGTADASDSKGAGTKRVAQVTIRDVQAKKFAVGNGTNIGMCHGDSGGPTFFTFPDGVERVVGIHSYALNETCLDGYDMRTDAFAAFIEAYVGENEGTCEEGDGCAVDCDEPDPDCACLADDECSPLCKSAELDPDCPEECHEDGECAEDCGAPDPDCTIDGEACTNDADCAGQECVVGGDDEGICSRRCEDDDDCLNKMTCDEDAGYCVTKTFEYASANTSCDAEDMTALCADGTQCLRLGGERNCYQLCSADSDCKDGGTCTLKTGKKLFCAPVDPNAKPQTETPAGTAAGCQSSRGSLPVYLSLWPVIFAIAALHRRRRANYR